LFHSLILFRVLLEAKADPNLPNISGFTALHNAAAMGHYDCVKLLLEFGANVSILSKDGSTPLTESCVSLSTLTSF